MRFERCWRLVLKPLVSLCFKLCWWCSQDAINWCSGFQFLATLQTIIKDWPIFRTWRGQTKNKEKKVLFLNSKVSLTHPDGKTTKLSFTVMNLWRRPTQDLTDTGRHRSDVPPVERQIQRGDLYIKNATSGCQHFLVCSFSLAPARTLEVAQRRMVSDVDCNSAKRVQKST